MAKSTRTDTIVFAAWRDRCEAAVRACAAIGGDPAQLEIGPPASESEVSSVEQRLGRSLPRNFRHVLLDFSRAFEIRWFLPDGVEPPRPLQIFCGTLSWNLDGLVELNRGLQGWVTRVFPDASNDYDRVWHDKLGFHEVGNGDYLALDVGTGADDPPVVYLSHDDGKGHGYTLGASFIEAIDRLTQLGCAGAEDWQWLPFTSSPTSGLDPDCENGRMWRKWLGIL